MYYININPISTGGGGGGGGIHPRAVFPALLRNKKIFSSNLVTFSVCKWDTIWTIKLKDRPFHVAMVTAQIKGVQKWHLKKFLNSDLRNRISNY